MKGFHKKIKIKPFHNWPLEINSKYFECKFMHLLDLNIIIISEASVKTFI